MNSKNPKIMHNKNSKNIEFFNLEKIRFIIKDATNLDIDYAFEDLIFSENSVFIIQYDKKNEDKCFCWFNNECNIDDRHLLFKSLTTSSNLNNMKIIYKGTFEMKPDQIAQDQISIHFKVSYMLSK